MNIVTIIGARPQFIKAAVVSRAFKEHSDIMEVIVHIGKYFDNILLGDGKFIYV
jgi:UDP-GlcNAc3NAcA epimerase